MNIKKEYDLYIGDNKLDRLGEMDEFLERP